jgi:hypothetical protein
MPSTVIRSLDYRPAERELEILFTTGRRYVYHDVPPEAAEAFRCAFAKGRHFNRRYPSALPLHGMQWLKRRPRINGFVAWGPATDSGSKRRIAGILGETAAKRGCRGWSLPATWSARNC